MAIRSAQKKTHLIAVDHGKLHLLLMDMTALDVPIGESPRPRAKIPKCLTSAELLHIMYENGILGI